MLSSSIRLLGRQRQQQHQQNQRILLQAWSWSSSSTTTTTTTTMEEEEAPLKKKRLRDVPISQVLKAKQQQSSSSRPVIPHTSTLREAVDVCMDRGLSGMLVIDDQKVAGLVTSRDLLRILHANLSSEHVLSTPIKDYMTPIERVIYAKPHETIGICRDIMTKLGIKVLPILNGEHKVEGIVTARDMAEFGSDGTWGGKASYLKTVVPRLGLSSQHTSMADPPLSFPLNANIGTHLLPHPYKNNYNQNFNELTNDISLSEDAYFVITSPSSDGMVYAGVADGVGSWREYGVDPREFSRALMEESESIILENSSEQNHPIIRPERVLSEAYERVKKRQIVGSSTACIAMLDGIRHQLHFSNLGDCGIIVLRHIDSSIAGALKRNRETKREERQSDLRVAFVSQQQLKSFNHPYQLGYTGLDDNTDDSSFKSASDSCTTSIHIRKGDVILMATDGLFDNVDIDDITKLVLNWERDVGILTKNNEIVDSTAKVENHSADLAKRLCELARENSLNSQLDGPFAILAKENDILWSGGMPDDCTIIAFHVVQPGL